MGGSTKRERGSERNRSQTVSKKAKAKVQTDKDNDSRDKLSNYEIKKIPAFLPAATILNVAEKFRQKGFESNRDYFREKVVGKNDYKDTFESYENYIKGRSTGKLDAMGRGINTGSGNDNRDDNNPILSTNTAATRQVASSGIVTSTGMVAPTTAEVSQATATNAVEPSSSYSSSATLLANNKKGRRSTILQKAKGLGDSNLNTTKRTLGA